MVIVTHRTSLIDLATRIIVVDDGRIVAGGPRDTVIEALQAGPRRKGAAMNPRLISAGARVVAVLEKLRVRVQPRIDVWLERMAIAQKEEQRGFEIDSDYAILQQEPLRARAAENDWRCLLDRRHVVGGQSH